VLQRVAHALQQHRRRRLATAVHDPDDAAHQSDLSASAT
jgi:hypothetical protein